MSQHHDPVHPDSDHLTPELIADLAEGLLDPESASHVQHHLDHCEDCRALQELVSSVTSALAALPPVTMPEDVEARLISGLPAAAGRTVVPISSAPSRRSGNTVGRVVGAAACVAAVMLIGAIVYPMLSGETNPRLPAEAASQQPTADSAVDAGSPTLAKYTATTSGTDYTADSLGHQVNQLVHWTDEVANTEYKLGSTASAQPSNTESAQESDDLNPVPTKSWSRSMLQAATDALVTNPVVAQQCIHDFLLSGEDYREGADVPLAIDLGRFEGEPAVIIVLPDPEVPALAWVWVVDPPCDGENAIRHWLKIPLPKG